MSMQFQKCANKKLYTSIISFIHMITRLLNSFLSSLDPSSISIINITNFLHDIQTNSIISPPHSLSIKDSDKLVSKIFCLFLRIPLQSNIQLFPFLHTCQCGFDNEGHNFRLCYLHSSITMVNQNNSHWFHQSFLWGMGGNRISFLMFASFYMFLHWMCIYTFF